MTSGSETGRLTRRRAAALLTVGAVCATRSARAEPAAAPATSVSPSPSPSVDVVAAKDVEDRMTVPVTLDGQGPFAFIVDTASNRTCISEHVAADLGLLSAGPLVVQAATGEALADSVRIDRLNVGLRQARNVRAPCSNAPTSARTACSASTPWPIKASSWISAPSA
jgi:predicted aspartyl protease